MPYGVDKKQGGDSKENDTWMEKCVGSISGTNKRTGKPYTEGEKIAICKAQLSRTKSKAEFTEVDPEILDMFLNNRDACIRKLMSLNKTFAQAESEYDSLLAKSNYDINTLELIVKE